MHFIMKYCPRVIVIYDEKTNAFEIVSTGIICTMNTKIE